MRKFILVVLAVLTALLVGCMFPEKFDLAVTINPNLSHHVKFDGRLFFVLAQKAKIDNGGKLPKDADGAMIGLVKDAERNKNVKSVKRSGDASMDVVVDRDYAVNESTNLFDLFTVKKMGDGTIQIRAPKVTEKDMQEIKKLDMQIDGSVRIFLPSNAQVIETNAQSKPGLIDKSYSWKIKSPQDAPLLVVRLK